jgi:hypothetical protein
MPAIPESTRSSIILRLLDHAEKDWPQLAKVQARYRGSFAYITGVLPGGEQIPLFRLRYGGSAHSFGFAIYSPVRDRYEDAVLVTGLPIGSPQEALDTACTVHLIALGHEPESLPQTNLRCHPHSPVVPSRTIGPLKFATRRRRAAEVRGLLRKKIWISLSQITVFGDIAFVSITDMRSSASTGRSKLHDGMHTRTASSAARVFPVDEVPVSTIIIGQLKFRI